MQKAHTREHVQTQCEQNRAVYPPLSTEFLAFIMYLQPFKIISGLALRTKATTDYILWWLWMISVSHLKTIDHLIESKWPGYRL